MRIKSKKYYEGFRETFLIKQINEEVNVFRI